MDFPNNKCRTLFITALRTSYNAIDIFMKITVNYLTLLSDCQLAIDALVRSYLTSFGKVSDYRIIGRVIRDHDRSFLMTYIFSNLHSASQNFADSCGRLGSWGINLSAVNAQYRGICLFRITIALGLVPIESSSKLSYYPQRWNFS